MSAGQPNDRRLLLAAPEARKLLARDYRMPLMESTLAPAASLERPHFQANGWPLAFMLFCFALLWFEIVHHLQNEWSINPQYGYGWSVPFLALYLIGRRWPNRPDPAPPGSRLFAIALIVGSALLFFPARFLSEANPDWRFLSWAYAFIGVTISLGLVFLAGGLPWVRYFAFPFLFFLVAVPWPTQLEQFVVQNLMRAVTAINVVGLNIAGVPAIPHGNVIEVGSGLIGIEEACSGVRSLQATLMISLFLGELYSFTISRRILLVLAGGGLAFICNLIRTAILVWMGANRGPDAIHSWHDPAGLSILLVCLFGLWLLSLLMRRRSETEAERAHDHIRHSPFRVSGPLMASLAAWLLLTEAAVQGWYRFHQSATATQRWDVRWPTSEAAFKPVPISPEAESLLRYNDGGGASWAGADGHQWLMYFFRWLPGRTAALFVKIHRPDICLPASGMTMVNDNGIQWVKVNGLKLPVRSYRFDDHGAPLHVFYCYWDARSSYENANAAAEEDWTARGRLRAAMRGRRELGAQMLEVIVWGHNDDAEAALALQQQLAQIVARS